MRDHSHRYSSEEIEKSQISDNKKPIFNIGFFISQWRKLSVTASDFATSAAKSSSFSRYLHPLPKRMKLDTEVFTDFKKSPTDTEGSMTNG